MDRPRAFGRARIVVPVTLLAALLLAAGAGSGLATPAVGQRTKAVPVATDQTAYAEPFLAVSPVRPQLLVGGANSHQGGTPSVVSFRSNDGGGTWTERSMAVPGFAFAYDPSVAFFSPLGVAFADVAVQSGRAGCVSGGSVAVFTSRNGGRTWGPPTLIRDERGTPAFADKPMLAADPTTGAVYVAWSQATTSSTTNFCQATPAANALLVEVSHDGGRTFGAPVRISVPGFPTAFGATMTPTPGGGLAIAFEASRRSVSPAEAAIFVADSSDGGKSFDKPIRVGPAQEPLTPAGSNLYATSWPAITTNPDGSVTLAWASGTTNTRIYTVERPAGGERFSHPVAVNAPPGADLMPSLGPGPVLGFLQFSGGVERPVVTSGGSNGFGPLKVAGPPGPAGSPFELGEYLGVQPVLGRVAMLWPQMAEGHQVVLFARTVVRAPTTTPPPTSSSPATTGQTPPPSTRSGHPRHTGSPGSRGGASRGHAPVAIAGVIAFALLAALALARRGGGRHRPRRRPLP